MVLLSVSGPMSGCATPGDRTDDHPPEQAGPASVAVDVHGQERALGPGASARLIERAVDEKELSASLERMIAAEHALTRSPLVAGNATRLLIDGPAAFGAMFEAIAKARHHVHLETYILADDEMGMRLAELLIERRARGVEVRVLYDAFGSIALSQAYLDRLRAAGVELRAFRPIDPVGSPKLWELNNRDHRKLLIVDGRIGFTGGMNVSRIYAKSSFSAPRREPNINERVRDTELEIEGPAVANLQRLFLEQWTEADPDGPPPGSDRSAYLPPLAARGEDLVRIVSSKGGDDRYDIYNAYLAAIEQARHSIWLTQAYFAPGERMLAALAAAARRGVDVRILVPGLTDHSMLIDASRSCYGDLLEAGVRIYERKDAMVHAKTAVIDGVWSTVGSTNFDYRSFLHDDEVNAVVVSRRLGEAMQDAYRADIATAQPVDLDTWRRRPLGDRLRERLIRLLHYWI